MVVTFADIHENEYEYTLDDLTIQFLITADKAGTNYEFQNLYAKTNPNILYNIFMAVKDKALTTLTISREDDENLLEYTFSNADSINLIYSFSTLERNQNIPTTVRDIEVLRTFVSFVDNNNNRNIEE